MARNARECFFLNFCLFVDSNFKNTKKLFVQVNFPSNLMWITLFCLYSWGWSGTHNNSQLTTLAPNVSISFSNSFVVVVVVLVIIACLFVCFFFYSISISIQHIFCWNGWEMMMMMERLDCFFLLLSHFNRYSFVFLWSSWMDPIFDHFFKLNSGTLRLSCYWFFMG